MRLTRAKTVRGYANAYTRYDAATRLIGHKHFPAIVVPYRFMKSDRETLRPNLVEWLNRNCGYRNWLNVGTCVWFTDDSMRVMFILQHGGTG